MSGPTNTAPLNPLAYETFYEADAPRAVAIINGSIYPLVSYEIEKNAHGATDSALIDLTLSNNPDWTVELYRDQNENEPVFAEIWAGFPAPGGPQLSISGLTPRFYGIVDQYTLQVHADTGTFRCRSLAAPLVDTQITTLAQNMTSVQFLNFWASSLGLKTNIVIPPGENPVTLAQVYAGEFVAGIKNMRVWDVLLQLAMFDDVDVWVDLDTIYYAAPSYIERPIVDLKYGRDLLKCSITHSPQFNKNIRVEVRTYSPATKVSTTTRYQTGAQGGVTKEPVTVTVPHFGTNDRTKTTIGPTGQTITTVEKTGGAFSSGFTSPGSQTGLERYVYYVANLSPQQCDDLAKKIWRQISMMEYEAELFLPMTPEKLSVLGSVTSLIRLHGTPYILAESDNTSRSNDYWPRRMTEEFSAENGWTIEIEAVNHEAPLGQVA